MMEERKHTVLFSMGSVTGRRRHHSNMHKNWEDTLSQSTEVLLNRNARVLSGGQALSIVSKLFAKAILDYIVKKENISVSNVMIECMCHPMLIVDHGSTRLLKKIILDVLRKREFTDEQKKEMFSPIILQIEEKEGKDKAAEVLETGYDKIKDPMLAQQIARFYIHVANWEKAEQYAQAAVKSKPENSYLWDTYGQIYKKRLTDRYKECLENDVRPTDSEINDFIELAMKGTDKFSKEQIVSEKSHFGGENDAGYFGEVRLIVQLLDLLNLWFPKDDKTELHTYLVSMDNPIAFKMFPEKCRLFLQNLYARSEKTMQVIEDKLAQLKNEREGEVFTLRAGYNPRQELVQLRENLDNYLGEETDKIPDHLSPEATASFIRRRVKRIGGRSCSSILDLRSSPNGDISLNEMSLKLLKNIESKFSIAYDYVTLITVTLVKNMTSKIIPEDDFRNLVEWSRAGYEMTLCLGDDERPQLEAFMYFVMIHWPTDSKEKYKLCPVENVDEAIKRWKHAFYKLHSKQKDEVYSARRRVTTYYFLGKGNNSKEIVYYKDINFKQKHLYGEALWRSKPVQSKLQQLKGTLLCDGWEILHTVVSKGGNKSSIRVRNSYPSPRSMWQKNVIFYLGFSWNGPKAYIQIDPQPQEIGKQSIDQCGNLTDDVQQTDDSDNRPKQNKAAWQNVATHEAYFRALRTIKIQLKEIGNLKKKKTFTPKEREKIKKEARLLKEREDLLKRRCDFVDRS